MTSSVTVVKRLLALAEKKSVFLDQTKIQKLLYIAFGIYYTKYSKQIFDELPEYWPYGPVFVQVYNYIKEFGFDNKETEPINTETDKTLEMILDRFGKYPAGVLSNWSHREGSAWAEADKKFNGKWRATIDINLIKEEFEKVN